MSRKPILYSVFAGFYDGDVIDWYPIVDDKREPITFRGPSGKPKAIHFCKELSRHPVHEALRVECGTEIVWSWTRKESK